MQVPYGQGLRLEPLVSRKLVYREVCSEGSETTKLGTEVLPLPYPDSKEKDTFL